VTVAGIIRVMPELPEVETVVTTLRPRVVGRTILGVALHRADVLCPRGTDLTAELVGRAIASVERRGKRIVFTLEGGNRFYVHLGMTGQLTVVARETPPPPHTHLEIELASKSARGNGSAKDAGDRLRFRDPRRFGGIWWLGADDDGADARIGPEPLRLRPAQLARRLSRTRRAIKTALLDQRLIAGLGNIYADESLFLAGIHPLTPANDLAAAQVGRLSRAIKATLRRAIRHRGSSLRDYVDAAGAAGGFQNLHRVYDRAGKPCRVCRMPIERIVVGGRSTHFCAKCQAVSKQIC
jgi:formamidopyrimidine-DNA glycosylase